MVVVVVVLVVVLVVADDDDADDDVGGGGAAAAAAVRLSFSPSCLGLSAVDSLFSPSTCVVWMPLTYSILCSAMMMIL